MKKSIHNFLLVLVAFGLVLGASDAYHSLAQTGEEPIGFRNVRLWINPEYDDPRLLVMLEGEITGAQPPVEVRFLVPSTAQMYSAGSLDAQNQYTGGPPDRESSQIPGWDEISYQVTTDTFRVEYYDASIIGQTSKRISYEFLRLYAISDLNVMIQEPHRSSDYSVSSAGRLVTDFEGFTVHSYDYRDLDLDSPVSFEISYTKTDPSPSLSASGQPLPGAGTESADLWLVVFVVLVLAAVIGFVLLRNRAPRAEKGAASRNAARNAQGRRPKGKKR